MRIELTEVESLEIINIVLKEKLAEQQLGFEREKKKALYSKLIEKYALKGRIELSEDGKALIAPDTVPESLKKASLEAEPAPVDKVKKKAKKNV
jgi:hypothetical protein